MIKSIYTSLAESTVSASWCPNDLAIRTETTCLERVKQIDKGKRIIFLDKARIGTPDHNVENDGSHKQSLTYEQHKLPVIPVSRLSNHSKLSHL